MKSSQCARPDDEEEDKEGEKVVDMHESSTLEETFGERTRRQLLGSIGGTPCTLKPKP
jgi:hypothetical protein